MIHPNHIFSLFRMEHFDSLSNIILDALVLYVDSTILQIHMIFDIELLDIYNVFEFLKQFFLFFFFSLN
jgi:hypothetical protein